MKTSNRLLRVLLVLVLLLSLISLAACQDTSGGTYGKAIEVARTGVWKDINAGKACSGSVAVLDGGKIVYSEGFGVADREKSIPVDTRTLFNMGSVSKTFCAAGVMLLVDDGKVELDAPVTKYLPEFKMADPRYKDITVRMLLNHTSGVPGTAYANNMGYAFNKMIYEDTLANLSHSHLKAAPGETAPYCNDGFTLAEMLIAEVSGRDYIDFLSERVFSPLSLTRAGLSVGERPNDGISAFYQPDTAKKVPPEVLSVLGAGGLSSNAEDLVVFLDSFSKDGTTILSEKSIAEMTKAQPSKFAQAAEKETGINPEMAYGLGFDIVDAPYYREKGIKVIGKGGDSDDFHAMMVSVPDKRLSVAVMEAGHGSNAPGIAFDVLDSVLEAKGLLNKEVPAVGAPPVPQSIPPEYEASAGYYAGDISLLKISFDFNQNVATMATMSGDQEVKSDVLTYRGGHFYTEDNVEFSIISVGGRGTLLASIFNNLVNMTAGEQVPVASEPKALGADINGAYWLRRNVRPFEAMSLAPTHLQRSVTLTALPGHVRFYGVKIIESPEFAGMASDDIRDQTELTLFERNGQTWARVSDMIYSPVEAAAPLGIGDKAVTIGKEGYNEWFKAGEGLVLNVTKPTRARVIVFSPAGSPIYDSVIDTGKVFVPAGSMIELAGIPGDVLKVGATSAAGQ